MEQLSNEFRDLKDEYLQRVIAVADNNGKESQLEKQILKKCSELEENYEIGLKQKLEDTARIIIATGGIAEK
jgi:hypothetical protein